MAVQASTLLSHQVDILYDFEPTPICTGTILSSYLVLTVASCLADKSMIKLSIQTQPQKGSRNDEDDEERGRETRYVDSFYPIKPAGPNNTFKNDHQLAIITLDKALKWREGVSRATFFKPTEEYSKISQPYSCFKSVEFDERWPIRARLQENDFSNCTRNVDAVDEDSSSSSHIFPPDCLSATPRSSGNDLLCPASLPGSGLFCSKVLVWPPVEADDDDPDKKKENPGFLCGVLSSDSDSDLDSGGQRPLYINVANYLHGIYLPDAEDDDLNENEEEEEEEDEQLKNQTSLLAGVSFNGKAVDFNVESFPYQLSIHVLRQGSWEHNCGAVLLDERTALTAAHCFPNKAKSEDYEVVAGIRQLVEGDSTHQTLKVKRYYRHPGWKFVLTGGNDIALVTVNGSFELNENVSTVWISSPDEPVLSDFTGTATGWGKFNNSNILAKNLTKVELPLLPFEKCKEMLSFFKESMVCARTGHSNVCEGDSGGPLVLQNYEFPDGSTRDLVVGVASFAAKECQDLTQPSAFEKVSSHYDWIVKRWRRNTTATDKFKCFNGQEIEEDWRCDEEFDCADGSDECGCDSKPTKDKDIPKTRSCGGEIELKTEEHDIIYRVKDSNPGKLSQCVWTIFNDKENHIELTLLDNIYAKFEPKQNQLIAMHNFTLQDFNTESITKIDQNINMTDSFITLIFRGPAGIRDSGFHLRLKNVGSSTKENALKFKRMDLRPTSKVQTHAYPKKGGYGRNERVFTVLTPVERGGRIKLNVTFGATEPKHDWFDIISIGQQPTSLFRLSEPRTNMSETVEGGRDETLLVFMSVGNSKVKRKGIKFTYFEDDPKLIPPPRIKCGGNINLNGDQDLVYEMKDFKSSCVWVISNSRAGSSSLTLFNSRSQLFNLTDGSSSLFVLHNFTRSDSHSHHMNEFGRDYSVDQPFFVLYFRSSPFSTTNGFYLKLRHLNSTSDPNSNSNSFEAQQHNLLGFTKKLTPSSSKTQGFSYPVTKSQNLSSNSNNGAIILVQPTHSDRKLHLNLKSVHMTNVREEWMEILTFRENPVSIYRTSGSRNIAHKSFTSSEGEPFVIYLKSNSVSNHDGEKKSLTFSYSEEQEIVKPIRSCGGVINLGRRHKISYRAPPGQRSHCLWIVHNPYGPHSNITASFDTTNSQLVLIQDDKITNLMRNQTIKTELSVVALLFRSSDKEHEQVLTVNLDGVGDFVPASGGDFLDVRVTALEAKSQKVRKLTHPPPSARTYGNNERVFILITPEKLRGAGAANGAGNRIQLNLTSIDLEAKHDRLELYTFRQNPNADVKEKVKVDRKFQPVFKFDSFDIWTNSTFLGESGEPFLLYFNSDDSNVQSGFKFQYTSIRSNED